MLGGVHPLLQAKKGLESIPYARMRFSVAVVHKVVVYSCTRGSWALRSVAQTLQMQMRSVAEQERIEGVFMTLVKPVIDLKMYA